MSLPEGILDPDEEPPFEDVESPEFADPGGTSALRAGKRLFNCPTCNSPFRLTAKDVELGYQCDECADKVERGYEWCDDEETDDDEMATEVFFTI